MKTVQELKTLLASGGKPPFPAFIDNSQIAAFLSCEEQWKWEYLYKLTQDHSVHLVAGGAYAAGLEAARLAFFHDHLPLPESLAIGAGALLQEYGNFIPPDKSPKTPLRMLEALDFYFKTWPPATDMLKPISIGGETGVEFSFAVPLPDCPHPTTGEPLLYSGKCDMLGARPNGTIFVEDDKTTTQMGGAWAKRWTLARQFTGYVWAARQYFEGVAGAVVRGVAIRKYDFESGEVIAYRPPWMVDKWRSSLTPVIHRMIHAWETTTYIPNLDHSCGSFSGCQFMDLCHSEQPEKWFDQYEINTWTPVDLT